MDTFNNPFLTAALRSDVLDAQEAAIEARRDAEQLRVDLDYASIEAEALRAQRNALLGMLVRCNAGKAGHLSAILPETYRTAARQEAAQRGVDPAQFEAWLARLPPLPMPALEGDGGVPLPCPTSDAAAQKRIQDLERQLAVANANAAGIATQRNALRRALGAVDPQNGILSAEAQRQKFETGVRTQAERQGLALEAVAALFRP